MGQVSFNFMSSVPICSEFGGQENKICHNFHFPPSISHEVMWLYAMTLAFWKVSFKPFFSTLLFHLHQEALSVWLSRPVICYYLQPHRLQHARLPCPSPTSRDCANSCPSRWWCYPTISSSVITFSSCLQSFPASRSFLTSQFFTTGGQNIGVSASASLISVNTQDWFPLRLNGLMSLQ